MGEVVVSVEKAVEATEMEEKVSSGTASNKGGGGELKNGLTKWVKFLPRMVLRVLLVEADDSTRQIIAALLRKCSYRVAAVPDGLKAWEMLKGRRQNIDLILTEVDLPSISGYALLTLIMEHEICKNIPVIMMSSEDSISTVYKCMLRGAADYLVKPIRKNELRNLWQHVWRRQSSTTGVIGLQDESVAQEKVEATAENNAASHSSGDAACIQRNKELIEKGSDAQSSCTKPDFEAESAAMDKLLELPQLKHGESYPSEIKQDIEMGIHIGQKSIMRDSNAEGLTVAITSKTCGKDGEPEDHRGACTSGEAHDNHYVQISSAREAIDLIGAFLARTNCSLNSSSVDCTGKFDFSPQLDLSLRRSSAFKRYTNRKLQAPPAAFINFGGQQREQRTNCENNISNIATSHNSDSSTPSTPRNIVSPATGHSKESEHATSDPQHGLSHPIPVKGIRFNDLRTAYDSVIPPFFSAQSAPPMPSPTSVAQFEPTFQVNAFYQPNIKENSSGQLYEPRGQNANNTMPTNHVMYIPEHKLENMEDRGHVSPVTDQSACSSFCNGNASHLNSIGYGSNCGSNNNVDQVALARTASEGKNEDLTNNGLSRRSFLREAALHKFRLKRKERCYEKKIRYESRKKLAEQRPRIKGQFVRQANPDPQAADRDG